MIEQRQKSRRFFCAQMVDFRRPGHRCFVEKCEKGLKLPPDNVLIKLYTRPLIIFT